MLFEGWDQTYKIFAFFCFLLILFPFIQIVHAADSSNNASAIVEISRPFEDEVVKAGGPAYFVVEIKEFKTSENVPVISDKQDVKFFYKICKLDDDKVIIEESETLAVISGENVSSFKKTFYIPSDSKEGFYALSIELVSLDGQQLGSQDIKFKIVRVTDLGINFVVIILALGFIVAIVGFMYEHRKVRKLKVSNKDFERYI